MVIKNIKEKIEKMALLDRKAEDAAKKIGDASKQNNIDDTVKYVDEHFELLDKYLKVRNELKALQVDESVFEITDDDLRVKFEKILSNKPVFKADERLRGLGKSMPDLEDLSSDEIDQLSSDYVTSWISTYDIVESLFKTKSLILGISVPGDLELFVGEARKCLAFQQYNAVYSLCRTMLETAMLDICIRMGKIKKPKSSSRKFYKEYPPWKMFAWVSQGRLRSEIRKLYYTLSSLIHGYKTIKKTESMETLKKTIGIIQKIYDDNQNKFID